MKTGLHIVLVEDEPVTARNLAHVLQKLDDDISIDAMLTGVEEAATWFNANAGYDLVFMDIKLADGLSFDIFKQADIKTPVIFVTAFNDYAITAFKNNGIDYILKPFDEKDVAHALDKFKKLTARPAVPIDNLQLSNIIEQLNNSSKVYKRSFLVHHLNKLVPVEAGAIAFFYTANEVVSAYTKDGKTYIMDFTIDGLVKQLDPSIFFKANRQFVINRNEIVEVDFFFNGRLSVKLKPDAPERILISKMRVPEFKAWMNS